MSGLKLERGEDNGFIAMLLVQNIIVPDGFEQFCSNE